MYEWWLIGQDLEGIGSALVQAVTQSLSEKKTIANYG
jgi:hypothetical protein